MKHLNRNHPNNNNNYENVIQSQCTICKELFLGDNTKYECFICDNPYDSLIKDNASSRFYTHKEITIIKEEAYDDGYENGTLDEEINN